MKFSRRAFISFIIGIGVAVISAKLFMRQKFFGKLPAGERLKRIMKSSNYKGGAFQNLSFTEVTIKNASYIKMLKDFFNRPKDSEPPQVLPSVITNLKTLKADKPTIVWFGHSSYLIKSKEITILVDPVLSGNASPVSYFGKSFKGSEMYTVEDLPAIDMLFISHDHYDHLDYKTIVKLIPKVKKFYTALGVGEHLEYWGVNPDNIVEFDWWDTHKVAKDIEVIATPARHFSGRSLTRAKSLWSSFVLNIHGYKLFLGGDSGYDTHFKLIGEKYGPFDIAMLENGQYGEEWPYIHTFPEETAVAAKDLQAKVLLPVHWSKFVLANHSWNASIKRLLPAAEKLDLTLTTPLIGEPVIIDQSYPNKVWWDI